MPLELQRRAVNDLVKHRAFNFVVVLCAVYAGVVMEIGGVVAFISAIGRLNDPWGDLVNYFRDLNVTRVKFRLLTDAVDKLASDLPAWLPIPMR